MATTAIHNHLRLIENKSNAHLQRHFRASSQPWWKFEANLQCLSFNEAEELLGFFFCSKHTVQRSANKLVGSDGNVKYIIKPTRVGCFVWSEEHCVDDIIIETFISGQKVRETRFVLNMVPQVEDIILTTIL